MGLNNYRPIVLRHVVILNFKIPIYHQWLSVGVSISTAGSVVACCNICSKDDGVGQLLWV